MKILNCPQGIISRLPRLHPGCVLSVISCCPPFSSSFPVPHFWGITGVDHMAGVATMLASYKGHTRAGHLQVQPSGRPKYLGVFCANRGKRPSSSYRCPTLQQGNWSRVPGTGYLIEVRIRLALSIWGNLSDTYPTVLRISFQLGFFP